MNEQNANPQVPAVEPDETVEEVTAEEEQDKTIEEQAAEDVAQGNGLVVKIFRAADTGVLAASSVAFLTQVFNQDYQVQLAMEGVDEPLVFNFKPVSPDRMFLEVETPIIPELQQYVTPDGEEAKPMPPELRRRVAKNTRLGEIDLMEKVIVAGVTSPVMSLNEQPDMGCVKRLPGPIFKGLFDAIWQVSAPAAAEDYMAIFRKDSENEAGALPTA